MILDDQQVCRYCGKDFPLTPDGSDLYGAHLLAEVAIQRGSGRVKPMKAVRQLELALDLKESGRRAPPPDAESC